MGPRLVLLGSNVRPPGRATARGRFATSEVKPSSLAGNKILAALPRSDRARLAPKMQEHPLKLKQVLFEPQDSLEYVYFPLDGMCCLLTVLEDGSMIEVATVGNEGMLGTGGLLEFDSHSWRAMSQIPGRVLRLAVDDFRGELAESDKLRRIVKRYTHALLAKVGQSVACNRLHSTEQRCCKWLLLTHDRAASDEFPITHEFLSQMLGVRRAGVSEVAARLQNAGLIGYHRGVMTITDRSGLEASSCECYETIQVALAEVIA